MAKLDSSKKTIKKKLLLCILYHNKNIRLSKLLNKIQLNLIDQVLIINDGVNYFFERNDYKKIKFINREKKEFSISTNRNIALQYAKKKNFELILFLDSDITPLKKLIENHLNAHKKNPNLIAVGGPVIPSFNKSNFNFWEFLDGRLSWFTSIDQNFSKNVEWPYHLPTCNLSLQVKKLFKKKIKFNENIKTGEDADLFSQIRKKGDKTYFDKNCKVKHDDRKDFLSFMKHHLQWGRHQYHNLFKINNKFINLLFLILFPLIYPALVLLQTFFVIKKWYLKNILYIFLFPLFFLVFSIKSIATYYEGFKDFFK